MNADSVKAQLKNFAVSSGCTFQEALVYYGLERTIYRLSVSPFASHFVLKGGIFLYAIFDRKYERTTTDVDLLARRISNSGEEMKAVFRDIFAQDTDDALVFDLDVLPPHTRDFSRELGGRAFYLQSLNSYGIIYIWIKRLVLLFLKMLHMVVDMCILSSTISYGVRNIGSESWLLDWTRK